MTGSKANVYPTGKPDLAVVGASSRAAAFSALRAGYCPLACDLFADQDLRAACAWIQVKREHYPGRLPEYLAGHPHLPVIYTGGLENHPEVLESLAAHRSILGNSATVVRAARDPHRLHDTLRKEGLLSPQVRGATDPPGSTRGWLVKPLKGSGGAGIRPARSTPVGDDVYFQEVVRGVPASALYVSSRDATVFLGITRQLVGESWLRAPPFTYCGSIGPLPVESITRNLLARTGSTIASEFGLRGLFGLDLVLRDREVWVIELNPRYTASVEILEEALDLRAVDLHVRACQDRGLPLLPDTPPGGDTGTGGVGKAIVYAGKDLRVCGDLARKCEVTEEGAAWKLADIPAPGEQIGRGRPVVTLFERADSIGECYDALRERATEIERAI